jgi:magnesium chelatase family protein
VLKNKNDPSITVLNRLESTKRDRAKSKISKTKTQKNENGLPRKRPFFLVLFVQKSCCINSRMGATVRTIVNAGMASYIVDIECQVSNGLPSMVIVGSASKSIDESRERVRNALNNTKLTFPRKRIAINLAPADIPKTGTSLDLGIAISILVASGQIAQEKIAKLIFIGEVGLDGSVRPARGIIGMLLHGKKIGNFTYVIPQSNCSQAAAIPNLEVLPVRSIDELLEYLENPTPPVIQNELVTIEGEQDSKPNDIGDVVGQEHIKRALEIAAAGGHNILISGPPGTGKSMLARAFPELLPTLTNDEIIEVSHLHSLSGMNYEALVTKRPFRAPHHSSTYTSIVGGGNHPRPGEITLSHRGVLFLDELPEFSHQTIEALRQPLEDKCITLSRSKSTVVFPADFILIATANPCPCGYFGSTQTCSCTSNQVSSYRHRISGPITDRIDIFVASEQLDHRLLLAPRKNNDQLETMQSRILSARKIQHFRYSSQQWLNGNIDSKTLKRVLRMRPSALSLLNEASEKLQISARSYMKIIRISQTIADLEQQASITDSHTADALQYRQH